MAGISKSREQRRGACLYREKEGAGRGDFERRSIGKSESSGW